MVGWFLIYRGILRHCFRGMEDNRQWLSDLLLVVLAKMCFYLEVEPTHLTNMLCQFGSSNPNFQGENSAKSLKPPPSFVGIFQSSHLYWPPQHKIGSSSARQPLILWLFRGSFFSNALTKWAKGQQNPQMALHWLPYWLISGSLWMPFKSPCKFGHVHI